VLAVRPETANVGVLANAGPFGVVDHAKTVALLAAVKIELLFEHKVKLLGVTIGVLGVGNTFTATVF
jgi:hypothetical protein